MAELAVVTLVLVLDLLNDATWSDVIDAAASLRDAAWYFRERPDAPLRSWTMATKKPRQQQSPGRLDNPSAHVEAPTRRTRKPEAQPSAVARTAAELTPFDWRKHTKFARKHEASIAGYFAEEPIVLEMVAFLFDELRRVAPDERLELWWRGVSDMDPEPIRPLNVTVGDFLRNWRAAWRDEVADHLFDRFGYSRVIDLLSVTL